MKYEIKKYADGQLCAKIIDKGTLSIQSRGSSYEDLFAIASIKEAWDSNSMNKNSESILQLFCLIGQRSDRRFNENESFDLKIIAKFINSMNFDKVKIFHPHSHVSLGLINNSEPISHFHFVKKAYEEIGNPILVSPDAGSFKNTYEIAEKLNANLATANKVRKNGNPIISVKGDVFGKKCLIVDDLADGGRTFNNLAKELKNQGADKVYLYVSHGQFNYGFDELKQNIDHIFCTNSYKNINDDDDDYVTQFRVVVF